MTKNKLLVQYDHIVDAVEDAASSQMWRWADWLADNVPSSKGGRPKPETRVSGLTLAELAERRGHSVQHLGKIRRVAAATRDDRLPDVSLRAYQAALEATDWNLAAANKRLGQKGTSLRSQQDGPMMSPQALASEMAKQPPEVQGRIIQDAVPNLPVGERYRIKEAASQGDHQIIGGETAAARQREKRIAAHGLRWVEANGHLRDARSKAMKVLSLAREVEFDDEERDLLTDDIDQLTALLGLCKLALNGTSGVDWDAELERMTT